MCSLFHFLAVTWGVYRKYLAAGGSWYFLFVFCVFTLEVGSRTLSGKFYTGGVEGGRLGALNAKHTIGPLDMP